MIPPRQTLFHKRVKADRTVQEDKSTEKTACCFSESSQQWWCFGALIWEKKSSIMHVLNAVLQDLFTSVWYGYTWNWIWNTSSKQPENKAHIYEQDHACVRPVNSPWSLSTMVLFCNITQEGVLLYGISSRVWCGRKHKAARCHFSLKLRPLLLFWSVQSVSRSGSQLTPTENATNCTTQHQQLNPRSKRHD